MPKARRVPVRWCCPHRHKVPKAGQVHLGGRLGEDRQVHEQGVRPARGTVRLVPSLSSTAMSSEKALTEAAVCTTTSGDPPAPPRGLLADVGYGARADHHHAIGPGDGGLGFGEGLLVGVQLSVRFAPDDRAPDLEAPAEQALGLLLDVVTGAPHRRGVDDERHARRCEVSRAVPADEELRDALGQEVERPGADLDPAHSDGSQPPFGIGGV